MKAIRNIIFPALVATCIFSIPSISSAEFKVATIDMSRVMNESDLAKSKKEEIDKLIQDAEKKTEAKKKSLSSLQEKLKESKDAKSSEKFETEAKELERFAQDTREEIKKKVAATSKGIAEKANGIIKAYAKKNGYSLVFDKSDKYGTPVLYSESSSDITDEVMKEMNE